MKKHFLFFFTIAIICLTQATAQKRTFYKEGKLVDTFHSPVLINLSKLYDTVITYDFHTDWSSFKRPCKIFAIKQHKYYKLDCLIGFYHDYPAYYDSVQITKTVACSDTAGKAFLSRLESYHIYNLPICKNEMGCNLYDSTGAIKSSIWTEDLGYQRFQFFDKHTFKVVEYYDPKYLYNLCHEPKLIPMVELIDLFEKGW